MSLNILQRSIIDGSIVLLFEPFHSLLFADSMLSSDSAFASSAEANSASWSLEHDVEVHTENTSEGVILNTQINVLLNTESEASSIREISLLEFSILDLESSFKDLVSLISSDGDMDSDFLITLDRETTNGIFSS